MPPPPRLNLPVPGTYIYIVHVKMRYMTPMHAFILKVGICNLYNIHMVLLLDQCHNLIIHMYFTKIVIQTSSIRHISHRDVINHTPVSQHCVHITLNIIELQAIIYNTTQGNYSIVI